MGKFPFTIVLRYRLARACRLLPLTITRITTRWSFPPACRSKYQAQHRFAMLACLPCAGPCRRMSVPLRESQMKIEIFDQTYNVQAEGDEAYLRQLASFVDEKMRAVAEATRQVDSTRLAVLASLNIADELFTLRRRQGEIEGPLRKRVEKCVNLVEKALESSR